MTTHIVSAPADLQKFVDRWLEDHDEEIISAGLGEGFDEDQIRQALVEGHDGRHGKHLGDRDRLRRECRAIHHGSTAATCGEPSSKMSPIWDGVTCERCLALRMRSAK